jgi:hypothetical protein
VEHQPASFGIDPSEVPGRAEHTHLAVAAAVAAGRADAGRGILAAARTFGLDFIPAAQEPYDLVRRASEAPLWAVLERPDFRADVEALGGYSCAEAGTTYPKPRPVHVVPLHNPVTGPAFARQSFHLGYSPPVRPSEGGVIVDPAGDSTVVLAADLFEVFCSHPDVDALPQDLFADEPRDVSAPSPVLVLSPGQEEAYLPRP